MSADAVREMPRYQCHKKVWALKIKNILCDSDADLAHPGRDPDGSILITPEDEGYAPFRVDFAYRSKHSPKAGGYFVVYDDGYQSYSPADAFEGGYTRLGVEEPA